MPSSDNDAPSIKDKDAHIFVLVHGLWGYPGHMVTVEKTLQQVLQTATISEEIVTIRPSTFKSWRTYDGIKLCAERVLTELFYEIETLKEKDSLKVTKISFIAYSLGGLISRYAIGILQEIGFFDTIEPVIFSSFATPHVGVHFYQNNLFGPFANAVGKRIFGKSCTQLFIADKEKLVKTLADPEKNYYKGLRRFSERILLANIRNDRSVAFYTSFITDYSPFDSWNKIKVKYLKNLPKMTVNSKQVQPEFVDLQRSYELETHDKSTVVNNHQKGVSFIRSNRIVFFLILGSLVVFVLPIWFPFVLCTSTIATIVSNIRIWSHKSSKLDEHWERVLNSVYGSKHSEEADVKIGQEKRKERLKEGRGTGISRVAAEGVLEALYAEERLEEAGNDVEDVVEESEPTLSLSLDQESATERSPFQAKDGKPQLVEFDLKETEDIVEEHIDYLRSPKNSQPSLFLDEKRLPLDEDRRFIVEALNRLEWIKIPVYIDVWNAHDGIVSRRGPTASPRGVATVALWAIIVKRHLERN